MKKLLLIGIGLTCVIGAIADENEWFKPLGPPPKASPRRISGGEALPPLPLPATPLRRSERKREPRPPTLLGKVMWGESATFTYQNGAATKIEDWNLCPGDTQQLMRKAGRWFGLKYGQETISLAGFDGDPAKMPVLLFNGGRTIKLDESQAGLVRAFVLKGGMVVFDSIAGSPYFYDSAKAAIQQAMPESQLRVIPADHPIYHILYDVEEVAYPKNVESSEPFLEGIYVGCRLGVVLSRYGLGCGWDDREVPMIQMAAYYDVPSANKIGINLIAYTIGYSDVAREEAKPELFGTLDEKRPTDEFVFAQVRHEGAWNVHPGGAAALLRRLRQNTSLRVSLKRTPVALGEDDITDFPFLYLTGLDNFELDDKAATAMRHFLRNSGTLFINNGLGLQSFDAAVTRELLKVLPDSKLEVVPLTHPIYSSVFNISKVEYSPAVTKGDSSKNTPYLEGITIGGDLRVIYSPYDIEASWQGCEHPLAKSYLPHSGMQLGINVVMYAMTH